MKRPVALALIGALSLAGAACKESGTTVSNNVSGSTNQTDEPGVANLGANAAPGGMQMNPQQFAETAAGSDLFEIESGKLAQRMGSSASVKSMGGTLVDEHTKSSRELKAAAAKVPGVALPVVPPPELQAKLDGLKGLKGQAFDRQFITDQIAAHRQSLTALNAYVATGEAQPLKEHAARATGVVQKHLDQLDRMQGSPGE